MHTEPDEPDGHKHPERLRSSASADAGLGHSVGVGRPPSVPD